MGGVVCAAYSIASGAVSDGWFPSFSCLDSISIETHPKIGRIGNELRLSWGLVVVESRESRVGVVCRTRQVIVVVEYSIDRDPEMDSEMERQREREREGERTACRVSVVVVDVC